MLWDTKEKQWKPSFLYSTSGALVMLHQFITTPYSLFLHRNLWLNGFGNDWLKSDERDLSARPWFKSSTIGLVVLQVVRWYGFGHGKEYKDNFFEFLWMLWEVKVIYPPNVTNFTDASDSSAMYQQNLN